MKFLKLWVSIVAICSFMALALTGCGGGGGSSTAQPPTAPPATLAAPTGVTAVGGSGQVTVSWTAVSGAVSYNVYYATSTGVTKTNSTMVPVLGASSTSYALLNLPSGSQYFFIVTAVNAGTESAASTEANATTNPAGPADLSITPGNSLTSPVTPNVVNWSAVTAGTTPASSYNIYRSTTPGVLTASGTAIASVTGPTTTYNDTNISNGTAYYYKVTAVFNAVGATPAYETSPSYEMNVTPSATPAPANPTGVVATGINFAVAGLGGTPEVSIKWTAVTGATSYNIYRSNSSTVALIAGNRVATNTTANPFSDPNPSSSVFYYVVTAVNANGESAGSNVALAQPAMFTVDMVSGKTLTFTQSGGSDTLTMVCAANGTLTYNGTLGGTAITNGIGKWGVDSSGELTIFLADGTTIKCTLDVETINTSTVLVVLNNVLADIGTFTKGSQETGTLTGL